MTSPARTRITSPGTTSCTGTWRKMPPRSTSARSATARRSISAARVARPSCTVSSPIDRPRMVTMMPPPTPSPVATDTAPAPSKISDSGSRSRRPTATSSPLACGGASALGPYWASRACASVSVRPATVLCNRSHRACADSVQNLCATAPEEGVMIVWFAEPGAAPKALASPQRISRRAPAAPAQGTGATPARHRCPAASGPRHAGHGCPAR